MRTQKAGLACLSKRCVVPQVGPRMNKKGVPLSLLSRQWTAALCVCAFQSWFWGSASAQQPPPGAIPTPQQLRPQLTPPPPATLPGRPGSIRELGKPSEELKIDVVRYVVDDSAPAELRAALAKITAPYVGKARSYEDLANAADAVTEFLQEVLGLYIGYAFLPSQDPQDGVIRIAVLEGRIDEVVLRWPGNVPVKREAVEAILAGLEPGAVLRVKDIERTVFLLNDMRGLNARFELRPGRLAGTASILVTPQAEAAWTSRIDADNHGSRYSGEYRLGFLGQFHSPFGRGDGIALNALSSHTGGLVFGLASYTTPVGADGLKLGTTLSALRYKLDKNELPVGLEGDARTFGTFLLYPAVRSRDLNLFVLTAFDLKRYNDKQLATSQSRVKTINEVRFSFSGDWRDSVFSGGVNSYELSVLGGRLKSDVPEALTNNPSRFQTVDLNLTRLQNIVNNRLLGYVALRAQAARNNLDSAEQFQLGGADRVRAFAPGEATGDEGVVGTLELRLLPPESWFGRVAREMVLSVFADAGRVRFRHDPSREPADFVNTKTLTGWGFGGIWDRPRDLSLRVSIAWGPKGKAVNDPVERSPRVYALINKAI